MYAFYTFYAYYFGSPFEMTCCYRFLLSMSFLAKWVMLYSLMCIPTNFGKDFSNMYLHLKNYIKIVGVWVFYIIKIIITKWSLIDWNINMLLHWHGNMFTTPKLSCIWWKRSFVSRVWEIMFLTDSITQLRSNRPNLAQWK